MAGFSLNPITAASNLANIGLSFIKRVFTTFVSDNSGTSISRVADIARVEPITIVENRLSQHENIIDILETSLNLYSCIYMQAVALTNTGVGKIQTITRLGALSTKGGKINITAVLGKEIGFESLNDQPQALGVVSEMIDVNESEEIYKEGLPSTEDFLGIKNNDNRVEINNKTGAREVIKDATNLAVGKVLDVTMTNEGVDFTIPISIVLATTDATSGVVSDILLSSIDKNETALERKVGWSSGRLSFIKDIIFGQDIIRKHRKSLIQDKAGVRSKLEESRKEARDYTFKTGQASLAFVSNVMVVDIATINQLEAKTGYQLENYSQRNKILSETGIMLLVVVDDESGTTTFYIDGINNSNTIPTRALKASNKKNNGDITELFKAIVRADQPRL